MLPQLLKLMVRVLRRSVYEYLPYRVAVESTGWLCNYSNRCSYL